MTFPEVQYSNLDDSNESKIFAKDKNAEKLMQLGFNSRLAFVCPRHAGAYLVYDTAFHLILYLAIWPFLYLTIWPSLSGPSSYLAL